MSHFCEMIFDDLHKHGKKLQVEMLPLLDKHNFDTLIQDYLMFYNISEFARRGEADVICSLYQSYRRSITNWNERAFRKSSQSDFLPSVLQEFIGLIFQGVLSRHPDKMRLYRVGVEENTICKLNLNSFEDETEGVSAVTKKHDVSIARISSNVPILACETKFYVDKTMLKSIQKTAYDIRQGTPGCHVMTVMEQIATDTFHKFNPDGFNSAFILAAADHRRRSSKNGLDIENRTYDAPQISKLMETVEYIISSQPKNKDDGFQQFVSNGCFVSHLW
jgi:hypothetical protein